MQRKYFNDISDRERLQCQPVLITREALIDFAVLDDFLDQVRACFFGHIHSFDRKEYRGIPLVLTGAGGAAAYELGRDWYEGSRLAQAIAFDTAGGAIHLLQDKDSLNQ